MPASNLLLASKIVALEEAPAIRNIPGAPTAIGAFVGVTERGPVRVPQFVTSFADYQDKYGTYLASSDLPHSVEQAFNNGATAIWISRLVHYTNPADSSTTTAVQGQQNINDRGGAAAAAIALSAVGPFQLNPNDHLNVKIDSGTNMVVTFTATPASAPTAAAPFVLANGQTLQYQVKAPGSPSLGPVRTITFLTGDFSAIGAATAAEVHDVINRDGIGVSAIVAGGGVTIKTDKKGSDARLVIVGGTAITPLGLTIGTTNGSGNVLDIDAVDATEVAALLTAIPLNPVGSTAVATAGRVKITGVTTGVLGSVTILNTTVLATPIFAGSLPIVYNGTAAAQSPTMTVLGKDPGTYINVDSIAIEAATGGGSTRFDFKVKRGSVTLEAWPNLSMDPLDARYFEAFINANSKLVVVVDLFSAAVSPNNLPALGTYSAWTGANDGLSGLSDSDFIGSQGAATGLYAFDQVDNITVIAAPGRSTSAVQNALLQYCVVTRVNLCFTILGSPANLSAQGVVNYVKNTAAIQGLTDRGAFYWPRVKVINPSKAIFGPSDQITMPVEGHIFGIYARTDASQLGGVFQPPAGVERGILFGVVGFETDEVLDERKRDVVFPERINPLTVIDGSPRHVDGARTLKADGNWPSVSEARGVIFIETSLKKGLLFAKHRNNDRRLRMEVKNTISAFLLRQFDVQAFRGDTPAESFYVDVSDAINPPEVVFAGELHAKIGLATQKPAEFIVLTFTQDTRQLEERLATALGS